MIPDPEHPQRFIPVPEDTVYLILGVLRLIRDGVRNPTSNIETALKELKECASHSSTTQAPAGTEPAEQRLIDLLNLIKNTDDECCGSYGLWAMNSGECYFFNGNCTLCKVTKAIALLRGERR